MLGKVLRRYAKIVLTRICLTSKLNHNEKKYIFQGFHWNKMLVKGQGKSLLLFLAIRYSDETKLP